MSKDIFTQFTKLKNKNDGRKGYCDFDREKVIHISPREYGEFVQRRKCNAKLK